MGDYEKRSAVEAARRAYQAQAKIEAFRLGLTDGSDHRCETCRHWDNSAKHRDDDQDASGLCRVAPPRADDRSTWGVWPFTHYDDRCGQHLIDAIKVDELCLEFARENADG